MKAIVDLSVIPLGTGLSLSPYVAECEEIIRASELKHQLHANGTNIEGPWEEVFKVVKKCHEKLHDIGVQRVATNIRVST